MKPASTETVPLRIQVSLDESVGPAALHLAKARSRTALALMAWSGDQSMAINVLYVLARNALEHSFVPTPGQPRGTLTLWLRITADDELVIEVEDPCSDFPDFDKAVAGELPGRGLWRVLRLGAAVSWAPGPREGWKTVRAVLAPGEVGL